MQEKEKREVDYGEDHKVTVRNDFVTAAYPKDITAADLKLLRLVISQCRKNDTEFYEYTFKVQDIAEMFGVNKSNMYRVAHETALRLFNCNLKLEDGKRYKLIHILQTAEYDSGAFTLQLSGETAKLFLRLQRDFTNIPLLPILAMKNKSSIRIYELICQKFIGHYPYADYATEVQLTTNEIRKVTETEKQKSYDHIGHFKARIFRPAIEEIEKAAGWKIIQHDLKKGRAVIGFRLEVWSRNGWEYIEDCKEKGILPNRGKYGNDDGQVPGQMTFADYFKQ